MPISSGSTSVSSFQFFTLEGRELCRQILQDRLPYDPHDYQVHGICKSLDGIDLMAVTPTGSGKTTLLTGYMHVMLAILDNPELCPRAQFRVKKDPVRVMIVVCPTKALQEDMVRESVIQHIHNNSAGCRHLICQNLDSRHLLSTRIL
jgi:ATP-dependent helicase YprA (DUF1998 family)